MAKKIVSIVLAITVLFSAFALPASAADSANFENKLNIFLDRVVDVLVSGISALIVEPRDWVRKADYQTENFYEGLSKDEFLSSPAEGAAWKLGYANASIQTGNELDGKHFVGGSLSVTPKNPTEIRDDQKVRTIAVSDGRGISIFASVDSYGMPLTAVREIRARFAEYAKEKNLEITSITVSALHQHSCIDTFGLNGDIVNALFTSSFRNFFGMDLPSGQNPEFMENLYKVTVDSMITAVNNMETGKLYYGSVDIHEYIRDKRDPQVFDPNLNRLRFAPDNEESDETWILNAPIHCVGNGAGGQEVTGDYPYFMEQYINKTADANVFYVLGAELAITSQYEPLDENEPEIFEKYEYRYGGFGEKLGQFACSITEETEVAPILNIRYTEAFVPVNNSILKLAAKGGLLTNQLVKAGLSYEVVTEIGYAEFGTDLAVAIIPGEIAPEIVYGGVTPVEESWNGKEWEYPSFQEEIGNKKVLVFGITNDQIGYLLPSSNWHSYFTENEEIVSCGIEAAPAVVDAFFKVLGDVK